MSIQKKASASLTSVLQPPPTTTLGDGVNLHLAIASSASALFTVYQLDTGPLRVPGHGPMADGLNFVIGMLLAYGTPFLAWHTAANSSRILFFRALTIGFALISPVFVLIVFTSSAITMHQSHVAGLLWGSLGFWWAAGLWVTPSRNLKAGLGWLGETIVIKIADVSWFSARQIAD